VLNIMQVADVRLANVRGLPDLEFSSDHSSQHIRVRASVTVGMPITPYPFSLSVQIRAEIDVPGRPR